MTCDCQVNKLGKAQFRKIKLRGRNNSVVAAVVVGRKVVFRVAGNLVRGRKPEAQHECVYGSPRRNSPASTLD